MAVVAKTINESLLLFLNEPEMLDDLRLTFDRKLSLLVALRGAVPMALVTNNIRKINKIRNKLAHHLDFQEYKEELRCWVCETLGISKGDFKEGDENYRHLLVNAFSHVIAMLDCLYTVQKRGFLKI